MHQDSNIRCGMKAAQKERSVASLGSKSWRELVKGGKKDTHTLSSESFSNFVATIVIVFVEQKKGTLLNYLQVHINSSVLYNLGFVLMYVFVVSLVCVCTCIYGCSYVCNYFVTQFKTTPKLYS